MGQLTNQTGSGSDEPAADFSAWSDFAPAAIPRLEQFKKDALRDEWWSWPEAVTWVVCRDPSYVATLRYLAEIWAEGAGADQTTILGTQSFTIANMFGNADRDAEADLHKAIERAAVMTSGRSRPDAPPSALNSTAWRGGQVIYTNGVAALASGKNRLAIWSYDVAVRREDLMREFRPDDAPEPSNDEGIAMPHGVALDFCFEQLFEQIAAGDLLSDEEWLLNEARAALGFVEKKPITERLVHREAARAKTEHHIRSAIREGRLQLFVMMNGRPTKLNASKLGELDRTTMMSGMHRYGITAASPLYGRHIWVTERDWDAFLVQLVAARSGLASSDSPIASRKVAKRSGRAKGTGYALLDRPFVEAAAILVRNGESPSANDAARLIVEKDEHAIRGSSFEAKRDRIARAVRKLEENGE